MLRTALRQARSEASLTQQILAERTGLSIGTIRAIESGKVLEPGFFTVLAMASVLSLDLVNFLGRQSPSPLTEPGAVNGRRDPP